MNEKLYRISYLFNFENQNSYRFDLTLDPRSMVLVGAGSEKKFSWTALDYHQCRCCPLDKKEHPHCPLAVNMAKIVSRFREIISRAPCTVRCITPERTYLKKTTVSEGLSSILGIIMATSNCPVMELFKPMARFHLPFSTLEETLVRSASMYLLRQYFEYNKKRSPDLSLKKFNEHYQKVQLVNNGLLARINGLNKKDSDKNAILVFHSLAQILSLEINTNLHSIEYLFSPRP